MLAEFEAHVPKAAILTIPGAGAGARGWVGSQELTWAGASYTALQVIGSP